MPPYDLIVPISQAVDPNDTDRFQVRLSYPSDFEWLYVQTTLVHASMLLVHDEDDATTDATEVVFAVPPPRVILGARWRHDDDFERRRAENEALTRKLLACERQAQRRHPAASGMPSR